MLDLPIGERRAGAVEGSLRWRIGEEKVAEVPSIATGCCWCWLLKMAEYMSDELLLTLLDLLPGILGDLELGRSRLPTLVKWVRRSRLLMQLAPVM